MVCTSHTCLVAHVVVPFHRLQTKIPSPKGTGSLCESSRGTTLVPRQPLPSIGALGPGSLQTPRPANAGRIRRSLLGAHGGRSVRGSGGIFAGALRVCSHRSVRRRRTRPDSLSDRCPLLVSVAAFVKERLVQRPKGVNSLLLDAGGDERHIIGPGPCQLPPPPRGT